MPRSIYLDYQATTPIDPRVFAEMFKYFQEEFGNPHSTEHSYGWAASEATERARGQIADLIGADSDEIVFTSGATEANNLAILGIARRTSHIRRSIVISATEHKSVVSASQALMQFGFEVAIVPVGVNGIIDLEQLTEKISDRTALVSVMMVNNEIGTIQPIAAVAEVCDNFGVPFHCDAAQALAVERVNVSDLRVDMLSLSAHKIYGPKGVGALFVRRNGKIRPDPIIYGGGQEQGLRSGTLPTPLCVGFGAACTILRQERDEEVMRITSLRDRLYGRLKELIPNLALNGAIRPRHPGNLNVRFLGLDASSLLDMMQPELAASTGSACTTGQPEPSHVLRSIGLTSDEARSSLRLSLGRFTTQAEIDEATEIICERVRRLSLTETEARSPKLLF